MSQQDTTKAKVQPDILPLTSLFVWLGGLSAVVIIALIVLWQYFDRTNARVMGERNLAKPSAVLLDVRQREHQLLTQAATGPNGEQARIPIAQAKQMLLANTGLIAPRPKPTPAAVPVPKVRPEGTVVPKSGAPTDPAPAKPGTTEPGTTKPGTTEPGSTIPTPPKPDIVNPRGVRSGVAKPATAGTTTGDQPTPKKP